VPSGGPSNALAGTFDIVRVSNYPTTFVTTASLRFSNTAAVIDVTKSTTVTVSAAGVATILYERPASGAVGVAIATLTVTATNAAIAASTTSKTTSWTYTFYEGNAVRFLSVNPATLPTSTKVYGRTVDLPTNVAVRIANFPQHLQAKDVTTVVGGVYEATTLSVTHTVVPLP
jgi:hypothetical protein